MIISIATKEYDPQGFLESEVSPEADLTSISRTVSSFELLDGTTKHIDFGFDHSSRTFDFSVFMTEEQFLILKRLIEGHSEFILCTNEGVFDGIIISLRFVEGFEVNIEFLISNKQE